MLEKTRGIVLHHLKYGESSIISHIYTEKFGRRSFMIKGARGKSKSKAGMFQPLFCLNLEFYHKENLELMLVKEASMAKTYTSFPYDSRKGAQAMFIAEVLYKTLREEESNPALFDFLITSFEYFDLHEGNTANFHLAFLLKLTRFLGILPMGDNSSGQRFFDIKEGVFDRNIPLHFDFLDESMAGLMSEMLSKNYDAALEMQISRLDRNNLLHEILRFYAFHHFKLDVLNSLDIVKELFR
jgi:DNA repair protein RecO (recombination protein O)